MPATFEELLREYSRRAEAYLDTVRTCLPEQRSHTFLYVQLLGYVCSKFMLELGECDSRIPFGTVRRRAFPRWPGSPGAGLRNRIFP